MPLLVSMSQYAPIHFAPNLANQLEPLSNIALDSSSQMHSNLNLKNITIYT